MSRSLAVGERKGNSGTRRRLKLKKLPLLIFEGPVPRVVYLTDPREHFMAKYNRACKRWGSYAALPPSEEHCVIDRNVQK